MKIAVGGLWHETNTFAAGLTGEDDFRRYQYAEGEEIFEKFGGTRTELGGFLAHASGQGWALAPLIFAGALPSGKVSRFVYEALANRLAGKIQLPVDAVLLVLHGAMVAEGVDDCEADLLGRVRAVVGPNRPIVAAFDLHANLSREAFNLADALVGYQTYPHVDVYDRGVEAAALLGEILAGEVRLCKAFRKLPLLIVPLAQDTDASPAREIMRKVSEAKAKPGMMSASVAMGFPYSDVPRVGVTVIAYSRDSQSLAEEYAEDLARFTWNLRDSFSVRQVPPEEAVKMARSAPEGPLVLVDAADNIGGGSPGDGTFLLDALLAGGASDFVIVLADPEGVERAFAAGNGATVALQVGGKHDAWHGRPVEVQGKVRLVPDASFHYRGSYMTGLKVNPGRSAVIESGGAQIILTEQKIMPFDAEQLRCLGVEPVRKKIVVVKSAVAWKAAYEGVAKRAILVDTPGICSNNLRRFSYHNIPHPIYPLDPVSLDRM